MSLALAIKRVYRSFDPSPRRWIRKNYFFFFAYAAGLFTGFYCNVKTENVAIYGTITFAALYVLRWWAGAGHDHADSSDQKSAMKSH